MDLPKGTVGHHLKVLERAGLIRIVHTRQVRAVTEKFYGRVARLFLFQAEDPAEARALGAATLRDATFQLARAPGGPAWGLVLSRLDPKDMERFNRRFDRLIEDFRKADTVGGEPFRLVGAFGGRSDAMRSSVPRGASGVTCDFLKLWTGDTISQFGSVVSQLAIPLVAILILDASAFRGRGAGTVEFAPFLLLTPPAVLGVDRCRGA